MRKFIRESWLLVTLGVVFTALLAGTQLSMSAQIKENQGKALSEAIAEVVPDLASTESLGAVAGYDVFKCLAADGSLAGWAVQAGGTGFVDKIVLVFGLNAAADRITGLKVIENVETPGLGNKIEGPWADQYKGKDASRTLTVEKRPPVPDRNEIQAITGATWSSRYVTDIVNLALEKVRPELAKHR